jgi:hypothetical protein
VRDRIDHVAQDRQRRCLQERIDHRRRRIRLHQHVGRVDRAPSCDRRAVESVPFLEALFEALDRIGQVFPLAEEVDELGVDHLRTVLLHVLLQLVRRHK